MRKIFIVIKLVSIMLTVLFVHAISTQATPIIYTVNTDNNRLAQVDLSGNITDVGDLGFSVKNDAGKGTIDLATLNGKLYGLHSIYKVGVKLYEIDPILGTASQLAQLSYGGTAILHAEGLAGINGNLIIAFSSDSNPSGDYYYSTILADLALDGKIGDIISPYTVSGGIDPSAGSNFDFDGLGSNEAGTEMYGLDVFPNVSTDFIGLTNSFSIRETFVASEFESPNDLISIDSYLLAIDHKAGLLYRIDLSSRVLTSVELQGEGTYVGLASLNPVPEPTTVALLGVGLAGLAGAEVRRRRKKKAVDKSERV